MRKLTVFLALFVSGISIQAQDISHIETTKSWYYIYDQNGKKTKTLSTTIGDLQGFSASIFIVKVAHGTISMMQRATSSRP